jgi:predicted nucleic acid-binding protein
MTPETFIDTSGFFALLVAKDDRHGAVRTFMHRAAEERLPLMTTDYVLDETATLLAARGLQRLTVPFFDPVLTSKACRIEWTDSERFRATVRFLTHHQDKDWSFTDCLSFVVMEELSLQRALTKDRHFRQAGFTALLID